MKIFFTISILLFSIYCTSQTLNQKIDEINNLILNQDYEVALIKCNKIINKEKLYPELYLLKAKCLMKGRRFFINDENLYQNTVTTLDKAISLDSTYNYPYGRKGLLNIINRRFSLAISDYTKFISLSTDSVDLFNGYTDRGSAKSYNKDYKGAVEDYLVALNYDSTDQSIYQNLGAIYIDAKMFNDAISILDKGLQLYPKDVGMLNNIGFLYIQTENYSQAIPYFDKAVSIDRNDFLAKGNRGFCFLKLGKYNKARNDIDESILINPNNSYVYKYDAFYYLAKNEIEKACESLNKAIAYGYSKVYGDEVNQLIIKNCR